MDLSKVKLVISDMDGTLLNSKHEVNPLFFEQFKKLQENNIQFVAASGRQYDSIVDKLGAIENEITIVAENGAYIVRDGKTLFMNDIPRKNILEFVPIIEPISGINMVVCGKKSAYILNNSTPEFVHTITEFYSNFTAIDSFKYLPEDHFFKIALCHYEGSEKNIYPHVKQLEADWQVKISGEQWIDISQKSAHKGNAITKLQTELGISPAETMAFGDYNNDIEMLRLADFSFAMANAHPNVKEVANYSTTSNDEYGVGSVLEQLLKCKI